MCPTCITTLALVTSSATSASGLTALILKKFRAKTWAKKILNHWKENHYGQ
jgi:hypothetical protein